MTHSILVVDENRDFAHVLTALLAAEGYRVRCAFDGQAALQEIDRDPPDVVLADVTLPKVDGVSLVRRLRTWGTSIPVILMSAADSYVDVPGVAFVPKPFDVEHLLDAITQALAGRGQVAGC